MPDYDSGMTIPFIIDIPSSRIEELKQVLEGLEIKFDPENQVVAFNNALTCQSVAMGYDLPGMVVEMNRYLDETKPDPQDTRGPQEVEHRTPTGVPAVRHRELRLGQQQGELYLVGKRENNLAGTHAGPSPVFEEQE